MKVKTFACPRCNQLVNSIPLRTIISAPMKGYKYDCPHCGQIFTALEMTNAARNTVTTRTAIIDPSADPVLSAVVVKHRELRQWSIFLGLAIVIALLISLSPAMRKEMGLYTLAITAFALTVLFKVWSLARFLYPRGTAIGIVILSLFTVTFPIVLFCVDRKAAGYLLQKGLKTRLLSGPEDISGNKPSDGSR